MSALAICLSITRLLASAISNTGPVITLSYGSFQGNLTGDVVTVEFLGIPFAAPPYASYLFFSTILKRPFFEALGISDLLLLNYLGRLLEFTRLLVLEQLALSLQKIFPLFQASTPVPLLLLLKIVGLPL
jgi:hypothetical protein